MALPADLQFHIAGPVQVAYGNATFVDTFVIGQSDGQTLIQIEELRPHEPVTTDAAGGQPVDWIQLQAHAIIAITFIEWAESTLIDLLGVLNGGGPVTVAELGEVPTVGFLKVADNPATSNALIIRGTKITGANGMSEITFPNCFYDAETTQRLQNVGTRSGALTVAMYALPDGTTPNKYFSLAAIV